MPTLESDAGGDERAARAAEAEPLPPLPPPSMDPDLPAESFQVRIGDEIEWTDLNPVYDRDDSTKGNTNPKAQHSSHHLAKARSNSQRFSGNLKPKTPIIALPTKIQPSGYLGRSNRRPTAGRIFPKRGAAAPREGKAAAVTAEPSSPKVSCIGKVLSDRERNRSRRNRAEKSLKKQEEKRRGIWSGLAAAFGCCSGREWRGAAVECVEEDSPAAPSSKAAGQPRLTMGEKVAAEPVGLGAMKRFSSGRRPASWGGDEDDEGHMAWSGPLDLGRRRSVGTLEDAQRDVEWESEGSSSV